MSRHATLSEFSLSPHYRKGREGKGTGNGYLQAQVSQPTTARAFGDWTWR